MAEIYDDAASRLWWGVRTYIWVFLIAIPVAAGITIAAAAPSISSINRQYRATALVIATQLDVKPELVPRLMQAVFDGGTVSERAVQEGHLPIDPQDLIPKHALLEPVEDNVIARVVGLDEDARLAARIANSVATALVAELNKAGPGVGVFTVQDLARVPSAAERRTSLPAPLFVGIVAGLALGLGGVGLILTLRRPVLGPGEVADVVGSPIVGTPTLPSRRRDRVLDPTEVPGISALAKRLFPNGSGTAVLVSPAGDESARTLISQLLAGTLAESGPAFLVASRDPTVRSLYENLTPAPTMVVAESTPDRSIWTRLPVVIDGPSAKGKDVPQFVPSGSQIVLVVRQGTSLRAVNDVAGQFLPDEVAGCVFVRRSKAWPWFSSPARARVDASAGAVAAASRSPELTRQSYTPEPPADVARHAEPVQRPEQTYRPEAVRQPEPVRYAGPAEPARRTEPDSIEIRLDPPVDENSWNSVERFERRVGPSAGPFSRPDGQGD